MLVVNLKNILRPVVFKEFNIYDTLIIE